jgi:hypothetical protein
MALSFYNKEYQKQVKRNDRNGDKGHERRGDPPVRQRTHE